MRYHRNVYMPEMPEMPETIKLYYSMHAIIRLDEYEVELIQTINLSICDIIEYETDELNNPYKILIRFKLDDFFDICMPVLLDGYKVNTIWLNDINDSHETLDETLYFKP